MTLTRLVRDHHGGEGGACLGHQLRLSLAISQAQEVDVPGVDEALAHARRGELDGVREVEQPLALLAATLNL